MELEEMKRQWSELSVELAQQKIVNKELIMEMTKTKFRNTIGTIGKYEFTGSLVCIPIALYLLYNISKMNTPLLLACAVFCIASMIIIPAITFRLIHQMKRSISSEKSYKQSIIDFAKSRKRFLLIQKYTGLYALLLIFAFDYADSGMGSRPYEFNPYLWISMGVFLFFITRGGHRMYKGMTGDAEEMLRSLEDGE